MLTTLGLSSTNLTVFGLASSQTSLSNDGSLSIYITCCETSIVNYTINGLYELNFIIQDINFISFSYIDSVLNGSIFLSELVFYGNSLYIADISLYFYTVICEVTSIFYQNAIVDWLPQIQSVNLDSDFVYFVVFDSHIPTFYIDIFSTYINYIHCLLLIRAIDTVTINSLLLNTSSLSIYTHLLIPDFYSNSIHSIFKSNLPRISYIILCEPIIYSSFSYYQTNIFIESEVNKYLRCNCSFNLNGIDLYFNSDCILYNACLLYSDIPCIYLSFDTTLFLSTYISSSLIQLNMVVSEIEINDGFIYWTIDKFDLSFIGVCLLSPIIDFSIYAVSLDFNTITNLFNTASCLLSTAHLSMTTDVYSYLYITSDLSACLSSVIYSSIDDILSDISIYLFPFSYFYNCYILLNNTCVFSSTVYQYILLFDSALELCVYTDLHIDILHTYLSCEQSSVEVIQAIPVLSLSVYTVDIYTNYLQYALIDSNIISYLFSCSVSNYVDLFINFIKCNIDIYQYIHTTSNVFDITLSSKIHIDDNCIPSGVHLDGISMVF